MDVIEARIVRDTFVAPAIADPQHAAHDALAHVLRGRVARGARVAITAGSRGIANVAPILHGLAQAVRDVGAEPFFVAAMVGKDLSGAGMDTNVTARAVDGRTQKSPKPFVRQLFVRDLTDHSNGNANGIGLADFCLQRLADKIDWQATYLNALTAAQPASARLPVVCANDREAVRHALVAAGVERLADARVARIKNTLHIDSMIVSQAALATLGGGGRYSVAGASDALALNGSDYFAPFPTET